MLKLIKVKIIIVKKMVKSCFVKTKHYVKEMFLKAIVFSEIISLLR